MNDSVSIRFNVKKPEMDLILDGDKFWSFQMFKNQNDPAISVLGPLSSQSSKCLGEPNHFNPNLAEHLQEKRKI